MRLFFALWPDARVRAQLVHWAREFHSECGGRRMRPENLHLTLAFLGDADEAHIAQVERAGNQALPQAGSLRLDAPGYWTHNRIAWAGASAVPAELHALVADLRDSLAQSNVKFDTKPFVPHVTLVRNAGEPRHMPQLPPIDWPFQGFALVQSLKLPAGSRYEVRKFWNREGIA
jgi:RNA 2',3'-cyclic 3'-phosphodiesterase